MAAVEMWRKIKAGKERRGKETKERLMEGNENGLQSSSATAGEGRGTNGLIQLCDTLLIISLKCCCFAWEAQQTQRGLGIAGYPLAQLLFLP